MKRFQLKPPQPEQEAIDGVVPKGADGAALNLGFETGTLAGWTATGDAFRDQPVNQDGIATRWRGQSSNKSGEFFVGGFEIMKDAGTGTLTSDSFAVTHPYASFLVGGGDAQTTRVEIVQSAADTETVVFSAVGDRREQMRRVVADLRKWDGETIRVRLVDESRGGWGHLNFDDFRFHDRPPAGAQPSAQWRSTYNPLLQHLVPNRVPADESRPATETVAQMFVPEGFSVRRDRRGAAVAPADGVHLRCERPIMGR